MLCELKIKFGSVNQPPPKVCVHGRWLNELDLYSVMCSSRNYPPSPAPGFQRFLALGELGPKSRAAGDWWRGGAEARNHQSPAARDFGPSSPRARNLWNPGYLPHNGGTRKFRRGVKGSTEQCLKTSWVKLKAWPQHSFFFPYRYIIDAIAYFCLLSLPFVCTWSCTFGAALITDVWWKPS